MQGNQKYPGVQLSESRAVGDGRAPLSSREERRLRLERANRIREIEEKSRRAHEDRLRTDIKIRKRSSHAYSLVQTAVVVVCLVIFAAAAIGIVKYNAALQSGYKQLSSMKAEYISLKNDNDYKETKLETTIDAEEIYRIATEKLGMTYPQKYQVIYYNQTESEYVVQYEEIPEK